MGLAQRSNAALKQHEPIKIRRKANVKIKPSLIAVYASIFALVIVVISIGYHVPQDSSVSANASNIISSSQVEQTSVDSVVATNVAAGVAQVSNLPVADNVSNLAVSARVKSQLTQTDNTSASTSRTNIVESVNESRLVTSYTVVAGDTVDTLAARFGISAQTIKWANDLTSNTLTEGKVLKILPIDGVLYTVKSGDTIDSIAEKYNVDKTRLVTYNDLEVSGLIPNTGIILPSAALPANEQPGYVAPVTAAYFGTGFGGNTWNIGFGTGSCSGYSYGYCTCYAYVRRVQLGLSVGGNWGDASTWDDYAIQAGYVVNNTPSVGAIMQNGGGAGHVAIVESILANGDLSISEMNAHVFGGGWNIVSGRIVSAGNVGQYAYIH